MCPVMPYRWLLAVLSYLLIASPVPALDEQASCSIYDFDSHWQSVLEAHLTDILSVSETTEMPVRGEVPDQFWQEAQLKTDITALRFSELLNAYPEFCQLKKMKLDKLGSAVFVTLGYQIEFLMVVLERRLLTARYLARAAMVSPLFAANLLGHLHFLKDLRHTLEMNEKQLEYFSRIENALLKGDGVSHEALLVYSQAFIHLMLLIDEGYPDYFLDSYSRTISSLTGEQFGDFLELEQLSTTGIPTFLAEIESNTRFECRWHYFGHDHSLKHWVCGNSASVVPANVTHSLQY